MFRTMLFTLLFAATGVPSAVAQGSIALWGTNSAGQHNDPAPTADFVTVSAGLHDSAGLRGDAPAVVTFTDIGAGLPGIRVTHTDWGDYDDDGDLDLLLMGDTGTGTVTRVYRNDAGAFADVAAGLPGVVNRGPLAWGDYDNDGDLDLVLGGGGMTGFVASVYRNDAGTFVDIVAGLPWVRLGSAAWGDFDNDGDLDLALTGDTGAGYIARVYRNQAGTFADIGAGLPGVQYSSMAWGDYDNDGDLDLALIGDTGAEFIARVYRNDAGEFAGLDVGLPGFLSSGALAWGDYDNDGDLDLVLAGSTGAGRIAAVYRNEGGSFTDIGAGLPGVSRRPAASWGDYDNDGDLDLVLAGDTGAGFVARVYRNDAGGFADIGAGLPGVDLGSASWGDYDNDGDLDLVLTGDTGAGYITRVYRNDGVPANTPPSAPSGLSASVVGNRATLSWTAASDAETPVAGLSYNLRIGATPGGSEISSAMADASSGYRRVVGLGNAQQRTSWAVTLPSGAFYWSVQAVDGAWEGSAFAAERRDSVPGFTDVAAGLPGVRVGSLVWGDYDNDGDLDLALTGDTGAESIARVYRNDAGSFTDIAAGLPGVQRARAAWGDYDNDGDLDLALLGDTGAESIARLYRNDAGAFTDIAAGLVGVSLGYVAWGDCDNDGDLDLALSGDTGAGYVARVYRNDAGSFADIGAGLPGVRYSPMVWGDYDNDGDLDLLLKGDTGAGPITRVYRNDAAAFTDIGAGLPGVDRGLAAWGDYDNDGDLDLVLTGHTGVEPIARVYRNDGGTFNDIVAGLPGVFQRATAAWGDYDNDGYPDLLLAGNTGAGFIARVYRNQAGTFTEVGAGLTGVRLGSGAWGDYDNDGDLDLVLNGETGTELIARVYRNDGAPPNTPPSAPGGLSASAAGDWVTLSWSAAGDPQTPSPGLSYNLRIGVTPGGDEICPAMASVAGLRRVPELGNINQAFFRTFPASVFQSAGSAYWSVQAIDGAWAGSAFAAEQSFTLGPVIQSVTDVPGDQGGKVRLSVIAAPYDDAGEVIRPVASYNVWQRIDDPVLVATLEERGVHRDPGAVRAAMGGLLAGGPLALPPDVALSEWSGRYFVLNRWSASASHAPSVAAVGAGASAVASFPPGMWELVGNFAAAQSSQYTYRATTVVDSPVVSVYLVSAHTTLPSLWFMSDPDSGWSVDNIAPGVPQGFAATAAGTAVDLSWQASEAQDFQYFRVYRGATADFPIGPASLVHSTVTLAWTDESPGSGTIHYKLTALDRAGNESGPASASVSLVVGVGDPVAPAAFALLPATPNPFQGSVVIPFEVPVAGGPVRLEVYDVGGGVVRTLVEGAQSPGRHRVSWDGRDGQGRVAPAGVYFYRLLAPGFAQTRRLVLAR